MTATALPEHTEIAVVGAGPAGLALAATLAEAGIDHVVLDRLPEGANTSRACVVHARTLEVLDGLGAAGDLVGRGRPVSRFALRDGGRRLLTVSFDGLPTRYPYALMVPQYVTEHVLLDRLRALGGDVRRPCGVRSVRPAGDDGGEGVTLTTDDGRTLRARYAVGADGMHSVVREAAGIGFEGAVYAESFALADVAMTWAPGPDEVSLTFGPAGLVVVAPLPDGGYRVVGTVEESPATPDLGFVQGLLDAAAPGQARVEGVRWSSRFRIHHRVADRFRAGPLFLVGDAAHVHSPAGGQGMNTGIQDGHALGRAFAERRPETYEDLRRPVARRVVAFTDRMTRIATARTPVARAARTALVPLAGRVPALRTKLAVELAELNYR